MDKLQHIEQAFNNEVDVEFTDKTIRMAFIRKVYAILCSQLLVTLSIIAFCTFYAASFVLLMVMMCFEGPRRSFPLNIILLAVFTVIEGFMLGFFCSHFEKSEILYSVAITAIDFTVLNGILFVCAIILCIFGFVLFFFNSPIARLIYSCLGALMFSVYIIVDTQMMMGGDHKYQISPEDHIYAALNLYMDIVNLFMYILSIFGNSE